MLGKGNVCVSIDTSHRLWMFISIENERIVVLLTGNNGEVGDEVPGHSRARKSIVILEK